MDAFSFKTCQKYYQMHSMRNRSLSLNTKAGVKNTPILGGKFSGKRWSWKELIGFIDYLKYNRVYFCLNSQSTPHLITEMNNSKTPCIQQISSDIWREKGHTVKSYRKQDNLIKKSFCSPNERWEIMLRPTLPSYLNLKAVKISWKLEVKFMCSSHRLEIIILKYVQGMLGRW